MRASEHVHARDDAHEAAVLDHREAVVTGLVDEPRGVAHARVRGDRVGIARHHVGRVRGERLAQPLLEAAKRLEEDRPTEEIDVVRDVEIALVVGQHEIGLGDDPYAAAVGVDHRHAGQLVLAQQAHDLLHGSVRGDRLWRRVHDLAYQLRHARPRH
jgi:hypothetical protein